MKPSICPAYAPRRLWLGLATLFVFCVGAAATNAQAPVITNPQNLRTLTVNTAFRPGDFNPAWTAMAPMPSARAGFATAATNGRVYAIGGTILNDCTTVSKVEAYDPGADRWITGLAPLPPPQRFRPSGGALDNIIYVVGGGSTETGCSGVALSTVQAYDPSNDRWSEKPSMPTARLQVGLGVDNANKLLYAVGGASASPDFTALDTVEVYDPTANGGVGSWTTKQHLITPRGAPAVAAVNGKIYAIGGQKQNHDAIDTVEEFDPTANGGFGAWTIKPSRMPHPRLNSAAAIVEGKIYVMGGETRGIISTVDVYDPSLDLWTTGVPLPTARRFLGAAVVDDTIYAVGGEALVATVGQQFTYQITATNNPTSYDAFPLPEGLRIDRERGIISGNPTVPAQAFVVTFQATNDSGTDSRDVSLYIAPAPPLPEVESIVSSTCVTGRAGQPFSFRVLTNNAGPDAKLTAAGLPYQAGVGPQMTINPGTGLISGIVPPELDDSARSFGVELNLSDGTSAQSYLELTFVSDPTFPVVTSSSFAALVLNQYFSYTITADAPTTSLAYLGLDGTLNGLLPPGLSFDPKTGTISGIYTGTNAVTARVRNAIPAPDAEGDPTKGGPNTIDTIKKEPPPRIQMFTQGGPGETGTAPLNFFVGLHDLEIETLTSQTSKGTDYVIFTDDSQASGGAAGVLRPLKTDDYVSYSVPVPRAGTYDVRVGIKTASNLGIFQLAIDGVTQGGAQDEYAPTAGYETRDLGPFTFTNSGDKVFKFMASGRNAQSVGYDLVYDYIDLVPYFETESLPVRAQSAPLEIIEDGEMSGGSGTLFKATKPGDYLTYSVPIAVPGIYNVRVRSRTDSDSGKFRLLVDGVEQGYPQGDHEYDPTVGFAIRDLGTVKVTSAGNKAFKFLVTGRGPDSTGYHVVLDYLDLVLTSRLEAEALKTEGTTHLKHVTDSVLSGGAGILFRPKSDSEVVNYKVTIPVAGAYDLKVGTRTSDKSGIVRLAIDGLDLGPARDAYSAEVGYKVWDFGRVTFKKAGETAFGFRVTGHDPNSTDHEFVLDYVDLTR